MLGGRSVPKSLTSAYRYVGSSMEVVAAVEQLVAGPPQQLAPAVGTLGSGGGVAPRPHNTAGKTSVAERMAKAGELSIELARSHFRRSQGVPGAGVPRPADGPGEQAGLRGRAGLGHLETGRPSGRSHDRRRQLQGRQRRAWPSRGRPAATGDRTRHHGDRPARRRCRARGSYVSKPVAARLLQAAKTVTGLHLTADPSSARGT